MNPVQLREKLGKVLFLTIGLTGPAAAQSTLHLAPTFVHADSSRRLVLVNAPLSQLATPDSLRELVVGSTTYVFLRPLARVSRASCYLATAGGRAYSVHFSQIPVLELSTRYPIQDAPSVYARLQLTDTTGVVASTPSGIEFRGGYTQSLPKKSYELSLWADTLGAADRDLALLGMRSDNKWNLQAMYNDQLRSRLKVANELWQDIHQPYYQAQEPSAKSGIALAYTEVFLNGRYQGIYTLTERIDRKQLKLKKYAGGIKGELYKGTDWGQAVSFASAPPFDNTSLLWSGFEYKEPTEETNWQSLHDFVNFVAASPNATFYAQYQQKVKLGNAVDYFLFINTLRALDNMGKNAYLAKYKAGEPYFYAPWDLDGVLGNNWQGVNVNVADDLQSNGLFDRLLQDNSAGGFRATLSSRWRVLRQSILTSPRLNGKLLAASNYLQANNAYAREHLAWPDYTYDPAQLYYPMTWLSNRLAYLDAAFAPAATALATAPASAETGLRLYPNPAQGYVEVQAPGSAAGPLQVLDASGRAVLQVAAAGPAIRLDLSGLPQGLYLVRLGSSTRKLVVQ